MSDADASATEVADVDQLAERRQVEKVLEAKEEFIDRRREMRDQIRRREISHRQRDVELLVELQNLLAQLEPLLKETEQGSQYWEADDRYLVRDAANPSEIPRLTIEDAKQELTVAEFERYAACKGSRRASEWDWKHKGKERLQATHVNWRTVSLDGLKGFLDDPRFAFRADDGTYEVRVCGVDTTLKAFRDCCQFIHEIGLGPSVADDADAGFEYQDLLDEGPQEEGQKPELEGGTD
ncbi:hypothetical protein [Halovenus salina]|uniref:Uncharacterized protein n=1 Tax=Halovenus salina TaxID=1510225 RepID=A0ABD5W354_9EURY